ncbi:MAG: serine/threonine-protein kinase [Phycisphaerales bacterium]|nr:serine/threonine-protein kinase [Phycisphaerales bacterium]
MRTARWHEVRELLISTCELNPAERDSFLSRACAGDAELREEVESILINSDDVPDFLQTPAAEAFPDLFEQEHPSSLIGQHVGAYKVIKLLGSGGMGAVYLAARADGQYEKNVAIKLIQHRMISEEIIRRFHNERQTQAKLDHANIARLLDGGVTDTGLPYFVMEYVDGTPIDRFCDEQRLSTFQRITLFLRVMSAVQYAHRNLIVHRDLKPTNILVTPDGEPKLLDFGIARAIQPGYSSPVRESSAESDRIMTPEYASPEQILGAPITTATDVYSLGVILYLLLTGRRPYDLKGLTAAEIKDTVCGKRPRPPSAALGHRQAAGEPTDDLRRRLAGDLDAIVMKTLQKASGDRYSSVEQFSEDIRRYFDKRPVSARKPTFAYRASKFIQRNRLRIGAVVCIVLTLLGGFVATVRQSRIAIEAQQAAQYEARKAQQASNFLIRMLASVDPKNATEGEFTVREFLDDATRKIEAGELNALPEVEAEIRFALSTAYRKLGVYDHALKHIGITLHIQRQVLGERSAEVAESLTAHGLIMKATGQYDESEQSYREALELCQALYGESSDKSVRIMNYLGILLKKKGDWDEAESLYRKALAIMRELHGDRHRSVAIYSINLAALLKNRGYYKKAAPEYRKALDILRGLDGEQLQLASCLNNWALMLCETGDFDQAETMLHEALAIRRATYGGKHPDVATTTHNLGFVLSRKRKYAEAESFYRKALSARRDLLPENHPYLAYTLNNLAELFVLQHDYEKAERHCLEGLDIRKKSLPEGHPGIASSFLVLGRVRLGQGDHEAAEALLRKALAVYRKRHRVGHPRTATAQTELGNCLIALEQYEEAERLLLDSHRMISEMFDDRHPALRETARHIVRLYEAWGYPASAQSYRALVYDADEP